MTINLKLHALGPFETAADYDETTRMLQITPTAAALSLGRSEVSLAGITLTIDGQAKTGMLVYNPKKKQIRMLLADEPAAEVEQEAASDDPATTP